jgi:2-keto-4-pentenoate hydratase/2-oxohepta-3-ene-1,7-dioic acid hydratase in catechol pathway
MGTTRRTFLRAAGMAGMAALAARANEAGAAEGPAPKGKASAGGAKGLAICNLQRGGALSLGVRTDGGVLDVGAAARAERVKAPLTTDDVVRGRDVDGLKKLVADAARLKKHVVAEDAAAFGPALATPEKIIMMGYNYKRHCDELKVPYPKSPVFFNKYNNALLGCGGTIKLPSKVAKNFDYEVELVVVIGKPATDVSEADALSYVWGYATGNDFTARDLQFKTSQYMIGKSCDGFAPLGPWLVSADQVPDPQQLKIQCRVNGEVRQDWNTNDMIFSCAQMVSYASQHMTLKPGDIIYTGTPQGVIQGKPESERVWLKAGDKVSCQVGDLGELRFSLA